MKVPYWRLWYPIIRKHNFIVLHILRNPNHFSIRYRKLFPLLSAEVWFDFLQHNALQNEQIRFGFLQDTIIGFKQKSPMQDSTVCLCKLYSGVCIYSRFDGVRGKRQLHRMGPEENISVKTDTTQGKVPYDSEDRYVQSWIVTGKNRGEWGNNLAIFCGLQLVQYDALWRWECMHLFPNDYIWFCS